MSKKVVRAAFGVIGLIALPLFMVSVLSNPAEAESVNSIFRANVSSILSQSVDSCGTSEPNTAALANTGAVRGNHFSSCFIKVKTTTNAPGYNLMIQSIDGVQRSVSSGGKWVYDMDGETTYAIPYGDGVADGNTNLMQVSSENTPPTLPILGENRITPTGGTIVSPTEMNASSGTESLWGFAVPKGQTGTAPTGFDDNYTTPSSAAGSGHGKYAKVPTAASSIRRTATMATAEATDVYFGVSVSPVQPAGVYKGVVVFTATTNLVPSSAPVVVAVYPDNGALAGGTTIDVYGVGFTGVTGVTIGGSACTSVALISDSHLTCILPAKSAGSYAVVVTTTYGTSNSDITYTYTATPTPPGPNPYEPSGDDAISPLAYGRTSGGQSSGTGMATEGESDSGDDFIDPQGRSIFEDLTESVGDDHYNNMWLAIGGGALLASLLILLAFLLSRKWDLYIMEDLGKNRAEVIRILVEKVGLDTKEVIASLQTIPTLAVEKISKTDADKISELLEESGAKIKIVRYGRDPQENDNKK